MKLKPLRWRPAAKSGCPDARRSRRGELGFSLVEVLVAMLVFLIGSVTVAQSLAITTRMHLQARNTTEATRLAEGKFGELMKLDFAADPVIQITAADTLNANVVNYFDTPMAGLVTRRWQVQAGPTANTRFVTVRVIDRQGSLGERTVNLTTLIRQW